MCHFFLSRLKSAESLFIYFNLFLCSLNYPESPKPPKSPTGGPRRPDEETVLRGGGLCEEDRGGGLEGVLQGLHALHHKGHARQRSHLHRLHGGAEGAQLIE